MKQTEHNCRTNCGACCIAPSISSPVGIMKNGKKAGEHCHYLDENLLCQLIDSDERPEVCKNFKFDPIICGNNQEEALAIMKELEGVNNVVLAKSSSVKNTK
jgi:Fe-S-cluster containining protein